MLAAARAGGWSNFQLAARRCSSTGGEPRGSLRLDMRPIARGLVDLCVLVHYAHQLQPAGSVGSRPASACPGTVHTDTDWVGEDIHMKELITADAAGCCEACANHTGCKFWTRSTDTLQPPLGRCYLKASASAAKKSPGFEAGSIGDAQPSAPPSPPTPTVPPTFKGIGIVPLSCAPGRAAQQWALDSGRIRSAANYSLCLTAGPDSGPAHAGLLYTEPCSTTGLAPGQNFSLKPSPWPRAPGALITNRDGECVTMRGCCDGGPLQLASCATCDPTDASISPPPDCLMNWNATAGTFTTVASGLCLDAGMDLPQRYFMIFYDIL
eukprot:SAG31_NODE_6307_length_2073_cov_1.282168_3_plen_324_part_00